MVIDLSNRNLDKIPKGIDTRVTMLSLSNNKISDITPLKDLKNLEILYLASNKISDITPLKDLKNLEYLSLRSNQVTNISTLFNLVNLTTLSIYDNPIILLKDSYEYIFIKKFHKNPEKFFKVIPNTELAKLLYL